MTTDEHGHEHYVYDDNPAPWVLNIGQEPVELFGEASHYHQLAFACWDDCVVIDFFHGLTDGTGAYNVLRTLMYEYCRHRYDAGLSSEGIRRAGETIDESEWTDPASLPKPELHTLPVPPLPKAINLITDAVYLNAFLSELKQIRLDYTVLEHRPIRVASVADYRK